MKVHRGKLYLAFVKDFLIFEDSIAGKETTITWSTPGLTLLFVGSCMLDSFHCVTYRGLNQETATTAMYDIRGQSSTACGAIRANGTTASYGTFGVCAWR
jgi:hypothetical protein